MRNRLLAFVVIAVGVLAFAGCGSGASDSVAADRVDLVQDFASAWTDGDWGAMRMLATDEVVAAAETRHGPEAPGVDPWDGDLQCLGTETNCPDDEGDWTCTAERTRCQGSLLWADEPDSYLFIHSFVIEAEDSGWRMTQLVPSGDTG